MCGISAVISFDRSSAESLLRPLRVMHSALAHRGPDGEGFLILDSSFSSRNPRQLTNLAGVDAEVRAAIAFRRLKIRDLSENAAQPMSSRDQQLWLVFNGEIYNFIELRSQLQQAGHEFRTQSDTEVVLAAYRQWGNACFEKFNGMWAALIFDLANRVLIGSRDRLGIKPLFYSIDGARLLFASEAKALALARDAGPEVEPYRFQEFLLGFPPRSTELSFFKDVHPVPAGTSFEIDLNAQAASAPSFRSYWDLAAFRPDGSLNDFDRARSEFMELLHSSVSYELGADVEVGSLLSGGLDTSMIARLASRETNSHPLKTFSIVYDDPEMSELPYIRAVTALGNIDNHTVTMNPNIAWNSVDRVVEAQGQPLLGQDLIAQYYAYQLARNVGLGVVLDGQGVDEMLGGLPYYETPIFLELVSQFRYGALIKELQCRSRLYGRSQLSIFRQYVWGAYRRKVSERFRPWTTDWLDCDLNGGAGYARDCGSDPSALNRFLYHQVRHTNLPTVLLATDKSAMAHGIEARVPFLDHRIVEFCFRLPASFKIAQGQRKRILREAAKPYLPNEITERKDKKMFVSKWNWMPLREHASELREMTTSRSLRELPWIRGKRMTNLVENYLRGQNDASFTVWRLYTAWRWLETMHRLRSVTR